MCLTFIEQFDIEVLVTLSYGEGCIWSEEFMTEDLCEEDIVGDVFGFEAVATDAAVGATDLFWNPKAQSVGIKPTPMTLWELIQAENAPPP